jgi:hypothetical protein
MHFKILFFNIFNSTVSKYSRNYILLFKKYTSFIKVPFVHWLLIFGLTSDYSNVYINMFYYYTRDRFKNMFSNFIL